MEVNKLESREVLTLLFGIPTMITLIVLASIGVGHWVTTRSDRPTNVTVAAAAPRIDVNVPQAAAPKIQVTATPPNIDVNVPQQAPPTINVSTPPAVVTIIGANEDKSPARLTSAPVQIEDLPKAVPAVLKLQAPPATRPAPEQSKAPAPDVKKIEPPNNSAPAGKPEPAKSSENNSVPALPSIALREEDLSLDTLYKYAEKYVESYCHKNSLDAGAEAKKWTSRWNQSVEQAMKDNTDTDEQSYINRVVVQKRDCFDLDRATPEKIVEACRIMLRYRDGKLAWMKAMRDAITNENMKKTLAFLSSGVR